MPAWALRSLVVRSRSPERERLLLQLLKELFHVMQQSENHWTLAGLEAALPIFINRTQD
jgi:hypothetical protein